MGVYEVLAGALRMSKQGMISLDAPFDVEIIASQDVITCANGMIIKPHRISTDYHMYDLLVIPGGKGVKQLLKDKRFLSELSNFGDRGMVCSICTGALVLGAAGILTGTIATTHAKAYDSLSEYCEVVATRVACNDCVITAAGVTSSIALGVFLLRRMFGPSIAKTVADRLEIPNALRPVRGHDTLACMADIQSSVEGEITKGIIIRQTIGCCVLGL